MQNPELATGVQTGRAPRERATPQGPGKEGISQFFGKEISVTEGTVKIRSFFRSAVTQPLSNPSTAVTVAMLAATGQVSKMPRVGKSISSAFLLSLTFHILAPE